jgi:hypothetical protein
MDASASRRTGTSRHPLMLGDYGRLPRVVIEGPGGLKNPALPRPVGSVESGRPPLPTSFWGDDAGIDIWTGDGDGRREDRA